MGPIINYLGEYNLDILVLKRYFFTRHLINFKDTIYKNIKLLQPGENKIINLKNKNILEEFRLDIGDLLDRELMLKYNNLSNEELETILENLLEKNISSMTPDVNYASIVSGGIDSSLISTFLKSPKLLINLNCIGKDNISSNIQKFNKYYFTPIKQICITKEKYIANLKNVKKYVSHLFLHIL